MSKNWRNNSGFTIIEAIIVILIIGLLASILTYRYNTSRETGAAVATDTLTADIQYAQAKAMAAGLNKASLSSLAQAFTTYQANKRSFPMALL